MDQLSIGQTFGVNSGSYINAIGGITIGNHVLIGSNVTISSGRHPIDDATPPVFARASEPLPIAIEDDVWIGAGAVIMPGITLRQGTVVGANAVVTKSTEAYTVVAGVPARKIRSRIPDRGHSQELGP
jgi:acetyltransferase-like isoleucine patch superfamily enzyme